MITDERLSKITNWFKHTFGYFFISFKTQQNRGISSTGGSPAPIV